MKKYLAFILIILILFVSLTQQKQVKKSFNARRLSKSGFEYLTKFGVDIGTGHYQARFKLNKPVKDHIKKKLDGKPLEIDFLVLLDNQFEKLDSSMSCEEKYKKANKVIKITLNQDGKWTKWIDNELSQNVRQHMWYFAVGSCEQSENLLQKFGFNIEAEIQLVNSNGSQFSSEETGMITLYTVTFIFSLLLLAYLFSTYLSQKYREWPIIILLFSFILLTSHIFFYLLHLVNYSADGKGSIILQIGSYLSNMGSQFSLTLLLVLLAQGWSITYERIKKIELYIPVVTLVAMLHVGIMGLGFLDHDTPLKYHPYDGWVGYTIIGLRVCSLIYFLVYIQKTMYQKSVNLKIRDFANKLRINGGLYFISIPASVGASQIMAYYLQHRFICVTTLFIQLIATAALAITFMSKKSAYQQVAMKNRTELPSAIGLKAY
ncbi:hypothetical protein PPERSA_11653 [Pseudocohnilembus persalinus]|uniref:GPR180/TMEM145 transmembrane domain-containing protein n=1 Tax=Pseudocohnilembus persalinus TaxID=266149 RepID=A0A0V0Q9Y5_PSEPJ|nr:hypothetical protein PPERSA_11653 [Pseudocohnilembus persalinus]|eukprot:KRW99052.1 hypothetical protein PPERSA_11653 [Pseudocohnilembus persalinus]